MTSLIWHLWIVFQGQKEVLFKYLMIRFTFLIYRSPRQLSELLRNFQIIPIFLTSAIIIINYHPRMNNPYNCTVCDERYNETNRFPMMIGKCGHSVCLRCSRIITACPIRCLGFNQNDMRKNFAIIQFLQEHKRITENPEHKSSSFRSRKVPTPSRAPQPQFQPKPQPNTNPFRPQYQPQYQFQPQYQPKPQPRSYSQQPFAQSSGKQLPNLSKNRNFFHNGVAINLGDDRNIKRTSNRLKGYCEKGHPCTQFKKPPPQNTYSCDVCKYAVTGEMLSCRECHFDVCCDGKIVDIELQDYICSRGHPLGYNPRGNSRVMCDHCQMELDQSPHWQCRTCSYDACEKCVGKQEFVGEESGDEDNFDSQRGWVHPAFG